MTGRLGGAAAVAGIVGAALAVVAFVSGNSSLPEFASNLTSTERASDETIGKAIDQVRISLSFNCLNTAICPLDQPSCVLPPPTPKPGCGPPDAGLATELAASWGESGCTAPTAIRIQYAGSPKDSAGNFVLKTNSKIHATIDGRPSEWLVGAVRERTAHLVSTQDASIWKFQIQEEELWIEDPKGSVRRMSRCS